MADLTDKLERLEIIKNIPGDVSVAEALDMPIGSPTRFKVGDRVECRCGEAWYPATVVQIWYTPTKEEFPYDTKMPYQCELDSGELVWAPLDHDGCVRAAPPPPPPRAHIIRKTPGVSDDVLRQVGLNEPCCSEPQCNCEAGPMAVYRELGGRPYFMGISRYNKLDILDDSSVVGSSGGIQIVKLDDPDGALDGPGHVMHSDELMSECMHYDGGRCAPPGGEPPEGWASPEFTSMRSKDTSVLRDSDAGRFVDDVFPFDVLDDGSLRARVRADDDVKVLYEKALPLPRMRELTGQPPQPGDVDDDGAPVVGTCSERQWLNVVSVTRHGIVTALPNPGKGPGGRDQDSFVFSPELTRETFCYFPCDRIIAMKKGVNW